MSNGMKKKSSRVIDRYLMDIGVNKEETKKILRDHRLKSLPKEDHGLVHWEEWCEEQGWDVMPTLDTLFLFSESVIVPMEEKANHVSNADPAAEPLCGTKSYILPVMRLRKRLLDLQELQEQQMQRMQQAHDEVLKDDHQYSEIQELKTSIAVSNRQGHRQESINDQGRAPSHFIEALSVTSLPSAVASILTTPTTSRREVQDDDDGPLFNDTLGATANDDNGTSDLEEVVSTVKVADARIQRSMFNAEEFQLLKKGSGGKRTKVVDAPIYPLHQGVATVEEALQEWRFGFDGGPAIQDMNSQYGVHWRRPTDWSAYTARTAVVKEYTILVKEEGYTTEQAIAKLDIEQGTSSLGTLRLRITARRNNGNNRKHGREVRGLHDVIVKNESTPVGDDEEDELEDDDSADETYSANNRKRLAPSLEEEPTTPFPFPIRHLNSISDIWQEWVKGWEGEESFESLMQTHGKIWSRKQFWNEHNNYFYSRWRIVSTIKEAFQTGAVASTTEAIRAMEEARASSDLPASGFILSRGFKELTMDWRSKGRKDPTYADL